MTTGRINQIAIVCDPLFVIENEEFGTGPLVLLRHALAGFQEPPERSTPPFHRLRTTLWFLHSDNVD